MPVVIITAREVIISVYRVLVGGKGISVPAIRLAKYKTVCQQVAVAFALLPLTAVDATWLWTAFLWLAVRSRSSAVPSTCCAPAGSRRPPRTSVVDSVGRAANAE